MTLEIQGGRFGYQGRSPIIQDLNLRLDRGEVMAVLGPNGCGKTTLINTITGMNAWQDGQTLVHGRALQDYPARELWQQIGYVPQARSNVFSYTVMDMVLLGRAAHLGTFARPSKANHIAAHKVLERLEIGHLQNRQCNAISGGELQLVFIARALLAEPSILFLDEPESHLDFKKQLIILSIVERLAREDGIICMLNTHFPNHALRIADKCLLMDACGGHQVGRAQDVLSENNIRDCFGVNTVISEITHADRTHRALFPLSIATQDLRSNSSET